VEKHYIEEIAVGKKNIKIAKLFMLMEPLPLNVKQNIELCVIVIIMIRFLQFHQSNLIFGIKYITYSFI
jgi:hypothetical protein